MIREQAFTLTVNIFEEFYRQVNSNSNFTLEVSDKRKKTVDGFLDYVDTKYDLKSIGIDFLVNFIESGFNLYFDAKHLKFGTSSIQLDWIIGKKAIERYEKIRDVDNKYFRKNRKIRKEISLRILDKFKASTNTNKIALRALLVGGENDIYEEEKKRFYNTPEGLAWCVIQTSLYNHKSKLCEGCESRLRCKEMLKDNYPNLYKIRGYGK